MQKLRVLSLFAGIGGFDLGLERTGGFRTVAFCEIEPFAQRVLKKHWPDVPCFDDVRKLTGDDIGPVDVICGGYPCQPFSTAGKRQGQEDDRHLWPEFMRLVVELRPAWVIGENVAGHISMGLDDVLADLEAEGYACRTFVIPACAVGASHRRDRVWTVAHAEGEQGRRRQQRRVQPDALADGYDVADPAPAVCERPRNTRAGRAGSANGGAHVADTIGDDAQGQQPRCVDAEKRAGPQQRQTGPRGDGSRGRSLKSRMGGIFNGIPRKMDGVGLNGRLGGAEGSAKGSEPARQSVRSVRIGEQAAKAPPRLQQADRSDNTLPDLPFSGGFGGRDAQSQGNETVQAVRVSLHADAQQEPHTVQPGVSIRDWADQRLQALATPEPGERVKAGVKDRAPRLKALGNAVHPDIPMMIGRAILEADMLAQPSSNP